MKKYLRLFALAPFLILSWGSFSPAAVEVGVGLSSVNSGRYVPGLTAAYKRDSLTVSATTVGSQTSIEYESTYSLGVYYNWEAGHFLWGPLTAGFGGGVAYSQRGYRPGPSLPTQEGTDFNLGPALRLTWIFVGSAFFNMEDIYGLGIPSIELAGQDVVMFSLGWRL